MTFTYFKTKRSKRTMGLKFERTNDLDKLFDSFAVDPKKVEMPKEELEKQALKAEEEKKKNSKK